MLKFFKIVFIFPIALLLGGIGETFVWAADWLMEQTGL